MLSQGVIIYTFKSNWSNRELWNKQKQKENKSGLSKERVYSKELLSCGKNLQKDGDCLEQGAFSDYKSWSKSGLLKFFFFFYRKKSTKLKRVVCLEVEWKLWELGRKDGVIRKRVWGCLILKPAYFPRRLLDNGLSAGSGWGWARSSRA